MLIDYQFENIKCFLNKATFSMEAPSGKVKNRFPDNYVAFSNGYNICKTAVLVGENAGGKSSFVDSFEYFQSFFIKNNRVQSYYSTLNSSVREICVKEKQNPQKFAITVLGKEGRIFHYSLEIDCFGIVKESLSVSDEKKKKGKLIFYYKRLVSQINCNRKDCAKEKCDGQLQLKSEAEFKSNYIPESISAFLKEKLQSNSTGLVVSKLALLEIAEAVEFQDIIIHQIVPRTSRFGLDIEMSVENDEEDRRIMKDPRFFEIFRMVDYSIFKIEIDDENPLKDTLIYRKGKNGKEYSRKLLSDSSGVREFLAWSVQIFRVVYENKIIIADEMDRVLNPILSDRIIAFINGHDHKGQFIFTSHNVLHLNLNTYMKEQINFVTKDNETLTSELYSLAEFPQIRYETAKIYEFYMKGILGGTADE